MRLGLQSVNGPGIYWGITMSSVTDESVTGKGVAARVIPWLGESVLPWVLTATVLSGMAFEMAKGLTGSL